MADVFGLTCLLVVIICTSSGAAINVILGDAVEFPTTGNCETAGAKLEQRLTGDSTRRVASFDGSVWRPGSGYEDRMSPDGSVVLSSANMNDQGLYELTCGEEDRSVQLEVIEASEVSVMEGGDVRLPFHCVTAGKQGTYKVDKDGEQVFERRDVSSGEIRNETRLSVSPEWRWSHGDLTLTLQGVKPEDTGDYYLSYTEDGRVKKRSAVRLRVRRNPDQVPSTPEPRTCPTDRPTEDGMGTLSIVSLTVVLVSLLVGPLSFCAGWKMRSRRSKTLQHPADTEQMRLENKHT